MTDMELYCISSFEIGLFGSLFFLGFAIWGVLAKLWDNFGRRPILIAGAISSIIITVLLFLLITSMWDMYFYLYMEWLEQKS